MELAYTLTRSRRKTVSLSVQRDLTVVVRAPMRMPKGEIDRFVQSHAGWVQIQKSRLAAAAQKRESFCFEDGQTIPFRGREIVLATGGTTCAFQEERLVLPESCDREGAVVAFLRERARELVTAQLDRLAPAMEVKPNEVRITSAATRWGSCSGKNSLCFSWRVACLPDSLLEYIVVHELAHIREHNHSTRFWTIVESILPDYRDRRRQLRAFQEKILF